MAKYKITKTDEYYTYELPAHNECKLTRLHDPADVEGGKLIVSRSHFLPAGGGTDFSTNAAESIYYVAKGKLLFKGEDGQETLLEEGDSVHIAANSPKCVTNVGVETAILSLDNNFLEKNLRLPIPPEVLFYLNSVICLRYQIGR